MKLLKKIVLRVCFSKAEYNHYKEALNMKLSKSKLFAAMKFEADELHRSDNKRYYILETENKNEPFVILNSSNITQLKKDGVIKSNVNFNRLAQLALYYTA